MTNVQINQVGCDLVELETIEAQSNITSFNLNEALLDGSKTYHFGVSELNCPLANTSLLGWITQATELFRVVRRNVGVSYNNYVDMVDDLQEHIVAGDVDYAYYAAPPYNVVYPEAPDPTLPAAELEAETAVWIDIKNELIKATVIEYFTNVSPQLYVLDQLIAADQVAYALYEQAPYNVVYPNGATNAEKNVLVRAAVILHDTLISLLPVTAGLDPTDIYRVLPGRKFFSPADFVKSLSEWCNLLNREIVKAGIVAAYYGAVNGDARPVVTETAAGALQNVDGSAYVWNNDTDNYLQIGLTCDGQIELTGLASFWNNFTIRLSNTGAALLGVNTDRLLSSHMVFTNDSQIIPFYGNDNRIIVGGNQTALVAEFSQSVYQSSECRLKVSVVSHLPTSSNVAIREEIQTVTREIFSKYFLNKLTSKTEWLDGLFIKSTLSSRVYSGQCSFQKRSDRINQWNRLLVADNLRFFRFYLMITYRQFSETTGQWSIVQSNFDLPANSYWYMNIRFVSDE